MALIKREIEGIALKVLLFKAKEDGFRVNGHSAKHFTERLEHVSQNTGVDKGQLIEFMKFVTDEVQKDFFAKIEMARRPISEDEKQDGERRERPEQ